MARGCHAAGYRLAGADLDRICCRHLYGADRMLTAWPASDRCVVLAVGPHDSSTVDVYDQLLTALDLGVPDAERSKPPCCDPAGEPPADAVRAEEIAVAVDRAARAARRT